MKPPFDMIGLAVVASSLLAFAACGESVGPSGEIAIDTLADGRILVHNPRHGLWDDDEGWLLQEEARIGEVEGDGPEVFGQIRGLALDSSGRIHILDAQAHEVHVFEPDGTHVRSLGGRGEGPGEVNQPFGLGIDGSDRVWVADMLNNRYTVWDSSGTLGGTTSRPFLSWPFMWVGQAGFDGDVLVEASTVRTGTEDGNQAFVRTSLTGAQADTFPAPPSPLEPQTYTHEADGNVFHVQVPFSPQQHLSVRSDGRYWVGTSDAYRVHLVDLTGDTLMTAARDYDPVPVRPQERDSALAISSLQRIRETGGRVDPERVPAHRPTFRALIADDRGFLWVWLPQRGGNEETRFDVFDPEGRYLGQVAVDAALEPRPLPVVRGDRMWAHLRDDLDVSYVIGLRIERRP